MDSYETDENKTNRTCQCEECGLRQRRILRSPYGSGGRLEKKHLVGGARVPVVEVTISMGKDRSCWR